MYGALPPETRRTQARLFNEEGNEYCVMVASDAVGMGLNLNIRRIIFNALRKSEGHAMRQCTVSEIKQIAGAEPWHQSRYLKSLAPCVTASRHDAMHSACKLPATAVVIGVESIAALSAPQSLEPAWLYMDCSLARLQGLDQEWTDSLANFFYGLPAGRAGRRNSQFPVGYATCLDPADVPVVREAMAAPMSDLSTPAAGVACCLAHLICLLVGWPTRDSATFSCTASH